ncbi:MAG: hypothetical protein PHU85_08700 [Phycisphaerae bacterium]|nr:hypothetical protein [Phycisphaerae bacterium]
MPAIVQEPARVPEIPPLDDPSLRPAARALLVESDVAELLPRLNRGEIYDMLVRKRRACRNANERLAYDELLADRRRFADGTTTEPKLMLVHGRHTLLWEVLLRFARSDLYRNAMVCAEPYHPDLPGCTVPRAPS